MTQRELKYIFGPIHSWRLGMSLGIDPISAHTKICSYNCIYCQLGKTIQFSEERKIYVSVHDVLEEIKSLPAMKIDYYTFSGNGEPTLALNLGKMIEAVNGLGIGKTAVITNASLMDRYDVQDDLMKADCVLAKLDACNDDCLDAVNMPMGDIKFSTVVKGLKTFRKSFDGKLAIQIMFIEANKGFSRQLAEIVGEINPDEVQINTPLRDSAAKPLSKVDIDIIKDIFKGLPVMTVYDKPKEDIKPMDETSTKKRHGSSLLLV